MLEGLNKAQDEAAAEAIVAPFYRRHLVYASVTGDWGDFPKALDMVGRRLLKNGWPHLAERVAVLILDQTPTHGPSWILLAEALEDQGKVEAAESVLWDSCRLLPNHKHSFVSLGALLERQGRIVEAEALLRDSLVRFPTNIHCYNSLAHLLAAQGGKGLSEAESLYRRAFGLDTKNGHALLGLGQVLLNQGKTAEVPGLIEKLDSSRASTLRAHYRAVLGEIPHKPPRETPARPEPVPLGAEWATELALGRALRAQFLLSSPSLTQHRLLSANDNDISALQAKARELLAEARRMAPHHPLVAMIARRYDGQGKDQVVDESLLTTGRDFGLRLEAVRQAKRADALAWLAEDFPDPASQIVVALARVELGQTDESAMMALQGWLSQDAPPGDAPILAYAHQELRQRLPERAFNGSEEFFGAWDQTIRADDHCALLDIVQLGLALPELPLAGGEMLLDYDEAA